MTTANNVMRHTYRPITDEEHADMQKVKDAGLAFFDLCDAIGLKGAPDRGPGSRELSLAKTKIEEAVMWATKHISR
jgi:hypothetical protein